MRTHEGILNLEDADHFVQLLDWKEAALLLEALLNDLSLEEVTKAANAAGYDVEKQ